MSKSSVSESCTAAPASDTSSRRVQASSSTYSQRPSGRRNSNSSMPRGSPPFHPANFPVVDPKVFGSPDDFLLDQASPGLNEVYHDNNHDRINLKHALEDLSQQAKQPANNSSSNSNGYGNSNGNSKRLRMDVSKKTSPSKATVPNSARRNGLKDVEGSSVTDAKARKTS